MKLLLFFSLLLLGACKALSEDAPSLAGKDPPATLAQEEKLTTSEVDSNRLPAGISYEGYFKEALRWTDAAGENLLLLTETGLVPTTVLDPDNDYSTDARIYASHYLLAGGGAPKRTWKVYDFIEDCPVDVVAEFVLPECTITDLNSNSTAEIWLLYKTVCHGDVSPLNMKIIMYEDGQKYAMRGETKIAFGTSADGTIRYIGGEYSFDVAFGNGPEAFRQQALKIWSRNVMPVE